MAELCINGRMVMSTEPSISEQLKNVSGVVMTLPQYDEMKDKYKDTMVFIADFDQKSTRLKSVDLKETIYYCDHCGQEYIVPQNYGGFIPKCINCGAIMKIKEKIKLEEL